MEIAATYNQDDPGSIERHAKRLVGHSLREMLAGDARTEYQSGKGKGNLGDIVERSYFGINPGNISAPDFTEAKVELKTTPLKRVGKDLRAKERLVLQMIDYDLLVGESWECSAFLSKNQTILLLFYLWEQGVAPLDYVFEAARLWSFPAEDIEIMRDDWEKIRSKVAAGEAHLLSEGDTNYLAACVKGAKGSDRRSQPNSPEPAKPRAFSLKQSYMNSVIADTLGVSQQAARTPRAPSAPRLARVASADELARGLTLEQTVHQRFAPYLGKTADDIACLLGLGIKRSAKNFYATITSRILGASPEQRIAEFEKAGITVRTIRLKPSGLPKEAVSFRAFDYLDLVEQDWDTSDFRSDLMRRFFFVVYQLDRDDIPTLLRTQFWTMPYSDIETHGRRCFHRTIELITEDKADYLPKSTDNPVCHVRPHGRDSNDRLPTPTGGMAVRRSFWLNQRYLANQIANAKDS